MNHRFGHYRALMKTNIMNEFIIYTKTTGLIFLLSLSILTCSCQFHARPEIHGAEYLKEIGVGEETIDKITKRKDMSRDEFVKYYKCDDSNVRYLIAANSHVPSELLNELIRDENAFVRGGVASNPSLNKDMINVLKNDSKFIVRASLVANPSVPEDVIMMIYNTNKKHLSSPCAMNPNCPKEIKDDILKSDNEQAKKWLDIVDGWKKDGTYIQGNDGRWLKP